MPYKHRILQQILTKRPSAFPVVLINGPRRAGKTTLAKIILTAWGGSSYYSFDTPADQARFAADPEGFLRSLSRPVILDEVQNVPEIFNYLKKIVDEKDDKRCDFILTGSQQFQVMRHVSESLAGRVLIKELLPFCSAEIEEHSFARVTNNLSAIIHDKDVFELPSSLLAKDQILEKIALGGFPQVHEMSSTAERFDWYASYVETYIQRDLRALSNIQNLATFSRFVTLVAGRSSQIINYSEIGKDLGINYKTAQHYLSLLSASFLWRSVPPYFTAGSEKRLSKSPKGYFLDTGLAMFLVGLTREGLERNPMLGALFESYIFSEFCKILEGMSERASLMHFRAGEYHEVDLVLEVGSKVIPIEIKFSGTPHSDWGKGIRAFRQVAGRTASSLGYVLSLHPASFRLAEGVVNVPVQALI
jgi:predicted AAA+ superfamily ATPase